MSKNLGKIVSVIGNMISVKFDGHIIQNEVAYVVRGAKRFKSEVIKIERDIAYLQVFEYTKGIKVGDMVEFSGKMLSVQLGPGLIAQIFDGLQNPLPEIAEKYGFFLPIGVELDAISFKKKWEFYPRLKKGDIVTGGVALGHVKESIFKHKIMVPFNLRE